MSAPGTPISIRAVEDPLFGPLVSFGLSGAPSELMGDRAYRIPPLTDVDAAAMVREIKSAPLLLGYRGSEPADVAAIEDLLQRVAELKDEQPELATLHLDLVLAGAHGTTVLNASARTAPSNDNRSEWFVRRMSRPVGLGDTMPS